MAKYFCITQKYYKCDNRSQVTWLTLQSKWRLLPTFAGALREKSYWCHISKLFRQTKSLCHFWQGIFSFLDKMELFPSSLGRVFFFYIRVSIKSFLVGILSVILFKYIVWDVNKNMQIWDKHMPQNWQDYNTFLALFETAFFS